MRELPIVLHAHEVRAALAGTLSQVWRPMRLRHPEPYCLWPGEGYLDDGTPWPMRMTEYRDYEPIRSPFGEPGDRLWVRETFTYVELPDSELGAGADWLRYRADGELRSLSEWPHPHPVYEHCIGRFGQTVPATQMPRWASRLTLDVTDVGVARVQDISIREIIQSGGGGDVGEPYGGPVGRFIARWDARYEKRGLGWSANPWCWRVAVRRGEDAADE